VLCGAGVRNAGDDAIAIRTVERLRSLRPTRAIDVVADGALEIGGDLGAFRLGTVVEADERLSVDRGRWDLAVVAGGGWACDHFAEPQLGSKVRLAERLAAAGTPVVVTGQGIGPACTATCIDHLVRLRAVARAMSVRDPLSSTLLDTVAPIEGVDAACTGDDALGLAPGRRRPVSRILRDAGVRRRRGVLLFHARRAAYGTEDVAPLAAWYSVASDIARRSDLAIVGLAVNDQAHAPETATLTEAAAAAELPPPPIIDVTNDVRMLVGLVARADLVLSHSYHVTLFALAWGVPSLLVVPGDYYAAKGAGLAALADLPASLVAPSPPSTEDALHAIDDLSRHLRGRHNLLPATQAVDAFARAHLA
jgi:polysaccharide pyruvyl transferase WcaK-like protein